MVRSNMDDETLELETKAIISTHLQDMTKQGENGFKILSDFLKVAQACHFESGRIYCEITDAKNPLFIKMRELTRELNQIGANSTTIQSQIVLYTQELLRTYQGKYPEQALNDG